MQKFKVAAIALTSITLFDPTLCSLETGYEGSPNLITIGRHSGCTEDAELKLIGRQMSSLSPEERAIILDHPGILSRSCSVNSLEVHLLLASFMPHEDALDRHVIATADPPTDGAIMHAFDTIFGGAMSESFIHLEVVPEGVDLADACGVLDTRFDTVSPFGKALFMQVVRGRLLARMDARGCPLIRHSRETFGEILLSLGMDRDLATTFDSKKKSAAVHIYQTAMNEMGSKSVEALSLEFDAITLDLGGVQVANLLYSRLAATCVVGRHVGQRMLVGEPTPCAYLKMLVQTTADGKKAPTLNTLLFARFIAQSDLDTNKLNAIRDADPTTLPLLSTSMRYLLATQPLVTDEDDDNYSGLKPTLWVKATSVRDDGFVNALSQTIRRKKGFATADDIVFIHETSSYLARTDAVFKDFLIAHDPRMEIASYGTDSTEFSFLVGLRYGVTMEKLYSQLDDGKSRHFDQAAKRVYDVILAPHVEKCRLNPETMCSKVKVFQAGSPVATYLLATFAPDVLIKESGARYPSADMEAIRRGSSCIGSKLDDIGHQLDTIPPEARRAILTHPGILSRKCSLDSIEVKLMFAILFPHEIFGSSDILSAPNTRNIDEAIMHAFDTIFGDAMTASFIHFPVVPEGVDLVEACEVLRTKFNTVSPFGQALFMHIVPPTLLGRIKDRSCPSIPTLRREFIKKQFLLVGMAPDRVNTFLSLEGSASVQVYHIAMEDPATLPPGALPSEYDAITLDSAGLQVGDLLFSRLAASCVAAPAVVAGPCRYLKLLVGMDLGEHPFMITLFGRFLMASEFDPNILWAVLNGGSSESTPMTLEEVFIPMHNTTLFTALTAAEETDGMELRNDGFADALKLAPPFASAPSMHTAAISRIAQDLRPVPRHSRDFIIINEPHMELVSLGLESPEMIILMAMEKRETVEQVASHPRMSSEIIRISGRRVYDVVLAPHVTKCRLNPIMCFKVDVFRAASPVAALLLQEYDGAAPSPQRRSG